MDLLKELHTMNESSTDMKNGWTKDSDLIIDIAESVVKEIESKTGIKLDVKGDYDIQQTRLQNHIIYEDELETDFGAFNLIIKDAHLRLDISRNFKNIDEGEEGFSVKAAIHYNHHGAGSNGFDIGWIFTDMDAKVTHTQLKSKPEEN